jgi:hypothetical protein
VEKEYVEEVGNYVVTFTIEGDWVRVVVYDRERGDGVAGYHHFTEDPARLLENREARRLYAETVIEILKVFREHHRTIGNVLVVEFDRKGGKGKGG